MKSRKIFLFIYIIFAIAIIIISSGPSQASGGQSEGQVEIEIDIGPEFDSKDKAKSCFEHYFKNENIKLFPFDFIGTSPPQGSGGCPRIEFFGFSEEACWAVEIFYSVEPGILILMFWRMILWL